MIVAVLESTGQPYNSQPEKNIGRGRSLVYPTILILSEMYHTIAHLVLILKSLNIERNKMLEGESFLLHKLPKMELSVQLGLTTNHLCILKVSNAVHPKLHWVPCFCALLNRFMFASGQDCCVNTLSSRTTVFWRNIFNKPKCKLARLSVKLYWFEIISITLDQMLDWTCLLRFFSYHLETW